MHSHRFFTMTVLSQWSASLLGHFIPPSPGTYCLGDWVGPPSRSERGRENKYFCLFQESYDNSPVVQPVAYFPNRRKNQTPAFVNTPQICKYTRGLFYVLCYGLINCVSRFGTCVTVALTPVWREVMWNISELLNRCTHSWRVLTQAEALHMLMLPSGMNHIQPVKVVFYWLEPGLWVRSIVPARTLYTNVLGPTH
jgi:hypothetical protein